MAIRINDNSSAFVGQLAPSFDAFTASIEGSFTPSPTATYDGSFQRAMGSFDVSLRNDENPAPNYPFVTCMFAIGSGSDRRSNEPFKTNLASATHIVHQVVGFLDYNGRRNRYEEFQGLDAINDKAIHIAHQDFHYIQVEFNSFGPTRWMEDLAYFDQATGGDFDEWITKEGTDASGNPQYLAEAFSYDLAYNWQASKSIHATVAERTWEDHTNFNDSSTDTTVTGNVARDFEFSLMQDTLGWQNSNIRYQRLRFQGEIKGTNGGSYPVQIPRWTNASTYFSGTPVNGFTPAVKQLQGIILRADRQAGTSDEVTGWRNVNSTTDELQLSGAPGFSLSVGDTITVQAGDGEGGTSDRGGSRALYHENTHYLLNYYKQLQDNTYGLNVGVYANMGSQNWFIKRLLGRDDVPVADWDGLFDGIHWERADRELGFGWEPGETFYRTDQGSRRREYEIDYIPSAVALNRRVLKPDNQSHTYPAIWMNVNRVRDLAGTDEDDYTLLTEYDAAFVRSWSVFCWMMRNVAVQPEIGLGHDQPILLDEMLIDAGRPLTDRDFWTDYDPTANNNKGEITWRTPSFGDRGYIVEFENCLAVCNLRKPDSVGDWIPSYLDGRIVGGIIMNGQSTNANDIATLPDPGSGKVWRKFDRQNYVNNNPNSFFYNKTPSDYDFVYILSDSTFNDGSTVGGAGTQITCGPLEGFILMREDA